MSKTGGFSYSRDAVRVRVKKCMGGLPPDCRKFSIDPQLTSFEILQSIVAKAFDIKGDFALSYRALDDYGQEAFLPLLSDWDLDAAFLSASEPCLSINIDTKHSIENPWKVEETTIQPGKDVFGTIEIPRTHLADAKPQTRLPGLIMNKVERTFNIFQRAFNLGEEVTALPVAPPRPPLTDAEFRKFLDPIGHISHIKELRSAIYFGGVEPSLRKVVWKHILNVYPQGMSGRQRMDYMKDKTKEYEELRETWRHNLQLGHSNEELAYVTSMVRKDVLRTDRHHKFYAGSDDNQNIASLFNILTTYAMNHPTVSYCQGMSDLASPLLVTMNDEAHAYICFCALMARLKPNFMLDGAIMTLKFQHLTEGLQQCDPEFYTYLKYHQAEDLLFCYRWLLLDMKREFAFDEALHMLEVLWSSLEAVPPINELPLYEIKFEPHPAGSSPPISPLIRTSRENPYTKVCAMRRQSSSISLNSLSSGRRIRTQRQNQSLDENVLTRQNRLRKQGHIKPFFSLDDNCMEMHEGIISNSRSTSAVHNIRDDPLTLLKKRVNSMKQVNNVLSSSMGNLIEEGNRRFTGRRTGDDKSSLSLNKLQLEKENEDVKTSKVQKGRTVKNLNEFLNFAGRGRGLRPRQRSQCSSISESDVLDGPSIMVTRTGGIGQETDLNSDVESDRSSLKHTSSPSFSSSVSPNVFDAQPSDDSSPDGEQVEMGENGDRTSHSDSSPDNSAEYCPVTTSMTRELRLELEHLDRQVLGIPVLKGNPSQPESQVFVWENPIKLPTTPDEQGEIETYELKSETITGENGFSTTIDEAAEVPNFLARSALTTSSILHSLRTGHILRSPAQAFSSLPPPDEFGGGNPFLMFLCLTLLRQHRDFIIRNQMDYNEMAMHFDKMVRRHNVARVLEEARQMFATYLKQQSLKVAQNTKNNFKV